MTSEALRQLLSLTLASSLGMIPVLALRRAVRRMFGAGASYSLWMIVPIAMLSMLLPHWHATGSTAAISALPEATAPLNHALDRSFDSLTPATSSAVDGALWGLSVWGAGAAVFALYLVGLQRAFVTSLGTLSGLHCVLRAEHSVGCPALIGVLRPKVILPADFRSRYTRLERLLIISHERTHLRRGDARWNALVALLRSIFWFNPLIHVAARYFRLDQELACDAAVLDARRGSRRSYASAMLKTQLTEGALPIGCHWRSAQDLKARLRMVSQPVPNRRRRRIGGALTTLMTVVVAYTAWAAEPVAGSTTTPATSASTADRTLVGWMAGWSGWLTSPNQAPDQPVMIVVRDARLFLAGGGNRPLVTKIDHSDRMTPGPWRLLPADMARQGQPITLEGHVHLTFTSLDAEATIPPTTIVDTNRAILVGHPDGTTEVQVGEATVQMVFPPQTVGAPQILPELLTPNPNQLTPRFKDADLGEVAEAVAMATHKTIIIDPRVRGQLTMFASTPMTPEAFYQAFLDILRTGDFVTMPVGPAGNVIRILPGTKAH
jgi:beta-lactamase regulating signal transducer with metallopeptidase domain